MKTTKFLLAVAFVAVGAVAYIAGTKHNYSTVEAEEVLDINPTANVMMRDVEYSAVDCIYFAGAVAGAQEVRNYDGPLENALLGIENLRDTSPNIHTELIDIFYNIWDRPVNALTIDQAAQYGLQFCNAHARR